MLPLAICLCDLNSTSILSYTISAVLVPGLTVTLSGNIGCGKTTFARFLIQFLAKEKSVVLSPTFTILQIYDVELKKEVWHFDLYRINKVKDILELGFEEALANGITVVEWPEKLGRLQPLNRLDITLNTLGIEERRQAFLLGHGRFPLYLVAQEISDRYCRILCAEPAIRL